MKSLTVFFDEPAPVVTEAVHLVFSLVGGLDLTTPVQGPRYGLNICEDFIGYAVKAPREISLEEVHAVAVQLANQFGVGATQPVDGSDSAILWAVAQTMRTVEEKNTGKSAGEATLLELQDFDADTLLFELCEHIGDANNVTNYSMWS